MGPDTTGGLRLSSPAFDEGAVIPEQYTCKGVNSSPPLTISGVPADTSNLALIMHDPDAPGGDYTHWVLWNIPSTVVNISENTIPPGAIQGQNSFGKNNYGGPCPPSGTHRYMFDLYALGTSVPLRQGATRGELEQAIQDYVLAHCRLMGTFGN